jgi:hypothetical protein
VLSPGGGVPAETRIGFRPSSQPGHYRYDLLFRDRSGKLLGRYHDYYSVVRRNPEARLVLDGTTFRVGDLVLEKIENPGTESLSYGAGSGRFERFEGSTWTPLDFEDLFGFPNIVPAIGLGVSPGWSSRCDFLGFVVPQGMTPGLYRVIKSEPGARIYLAAEFTILPPG